jgi:hypothetical protein
MSARKPNVRVDIAWICLNGGLIGSLRSSDITLLQSNGANRHLNINKTGIFSEKGTKLAKRLLVIASISNTLGAPKPIRFLGSGGDGANPRCGQLCV